MIARNCSKLAVAVTVAVAVAVAVATAVALTLASSKNIQPRPCSRKIFRQCVAQTDTWVLILEIMHSISFLLHNVSICLSVFEFQLQHVSICTAPGT